MSDYAYKTRAINRVSSLFTAALNAEWLKDAVLVPTPPSKMPDHPEYDDRIERVCKGIKPEDDVTVRNIVRQTKSYQASSSSPGSRITVDELLSIYKIDENEAIPDPKYIGIVDDLLTAATHYRAMHTMLRSRYPTSHITGLFIARRVFPETESVVI
ncbi:hypothetical protein [Methylobacterium aerolatum]|uniref:Uncharacterized protein n=1 Tax=Methylobacterium aerolatum TaxID=418708 RepID=A0ABU0I0K7_9HYPH|nr:hypothetical protein [Methylobacterium aerolatum]MDQ0448134.1 hypothetical protein [Methylobacterium aerolatum]